MIRAAILLCVLAVAIPAAARPQDEESKTLRAKLKSIRLDVDFTNFTVTQLADYLREVAGINIVVDPKADEIKTPLAMKAKGVTIQSILSLLLKPNQIAFVVEDGVLKIVPESKLKSEIKLEIIDVRDVLFPIRDFPGTDISLLADSAGVAFSPAADETAPEFPIVDLIKAHTGGKAWDENPRTSLQLNNGLLFVRQTPEVIAQVRRLVAYLRQYK
jgi:type II secretory pathway component GspD/PulD (secretin)